jgi:hypothetical protein
MNDDVGHKLLTEFVKAMAQELARQLYSDTKICAVSLARRIGRAARHATRRRFNSLAELVAAARTGAIADGELISVICKPSRFGPFMRNHFMPAIIGGHSSMRLGPSIGSNNMVLAIFGQMGTHLSPVGLYPPLDGEAIQASLYPSDAPACGFVSIMPGVSDLVPSLPAIFAARHIPHFLRSCQVTGVIRLIDAASLRSVGLTEEDQEVLRQQGAIWFLDATTDESECVPSDVQGETDLWGGLYASGHLEIANGELPFKAALEAIRDAMAAAGFEPQVTQNAAGPREFLVLARGCRSVFASQAPVFSIHMDAELAHGFADARAKFDRITADTLRGITDACSRHSVELANPLDLDFTYSDSASAFKVLESLAANEIRDPLAMAVRDWHRRRETSPPQPAPTSRA